LESVKCVSGKTTTYDLQNKLVSKVNVKVRDMLFSLLKFCSRGVFLANSL